MKSRVRLWLAFLSLFALLVATGCAGRSQSGVANQSQTCTVSFELYHEAKPFANEQIAIFPLTDGKISTAAEKKLGSGETDASGRGTLEFKCSESPTQYVFLWEPKGKCCSILRHEGKALSFSCAGSGKRCELGKIVFEVFEFGVG